VPISHFAVQNVDVCLARILNVVPSPSGSTNIITVNYTYLSYCRCVDLPLTEVGQEVRYCR